MARVELASQAWGWLVDTLGNPLGTTSATLKNPDGTNATHWSAVTAGSSLTTALTSNADGTLPRFVEEGTYTLTVGATTRIVEASKGGGPFENVLAYGASPAASSSTNAAAFLAAWATGRDVYVPAGTYSIDSVALTVSAVGGQRMFGDGASLTIINYAGSGFLFTFGDGTATDTRFQSIERMRLVGNANALGAVKFNTTRWCAVRYCDIRSFTNASAHSILIDGTTAARANYYNEIESCQFGQSTNRSHIKLLGNADGTGANSNYIFRCHFSLATDQAILIDGGDTNRIHHCEFADATPIAVSFANTAAIFNRIESCHFDSAVVKAWAVAGSNVADTHFLFNTGQVPIDASTDTGTRSTTIGVETDVRFGSQSITFSDVTIGRGTGAFLHSANQLRVLGGITTKVKAGTPTDADTDLDTDGTIIGDTTANKIWIRLGGVWKGVVVA